jgi:hypothetical protein
MYTRKAIEKPLAGVVTSPRATRGKLEGSWRAARHWRSTIELHPHPNADIVLLLQGHVKFGEKTRGILRVFLLKPI